MSANLLISWLDDGRLSSIANEGDPEPSIMATKYDKTCPSEFYRGFATLYVQIGDAIRTSSTLIAIRQVIGQFDLAIKALPAGEQQNGAGFALANVASYTGGGFTVPVVSATMAKELVCIAHCFLQNRALGL